MKDQETTKNREKKPMVDRYKKVRQMLECSFLNLSSKYIDTHKITPKEEYNVVDLFSGAGGVAEGFRTAGFHPIFGVEIDPDASATYRRNFPESKHFEGPIQKIKNEDIPKFLDGQTAHVLVAGFPCQGFSLAGLRDPKDKRNQLYKEVLRFAAIIKPWYVVLENVAGIASMKFGNEKVVDRIVKDFKEIGYPDMGVLILEAAAYGVPQLRQRAIFVANRFELKNPYPKPILTPEEYVPIEAAIDDLKDKPRDPSINHEWTEHSKEMEGRLSKIKPGYSLYECYYDAWKRQYKGVPAMTIKENHGGTHIHPDRDRVLSAREMARLQTFPDNFIFEGRMKRVMWQVGNAVPPLLFKHIGLALLPSLDEIKGQMQAKGTGDAISIAQVAAK